ncbi:MAG: two-component sensor histidine kinase [Rhodobacteraceae bacterium CG17_big_fil_post_rev_8_21_14_2_50_63_15]|nr:HAMP domain-containing histidine kinase [Roseovarius sp.]PIV79181.1 MAG: two-component sensor histidine kinase [Rhodobacteraceae bacterium CG17_big_fil_post_rev_8_21_14_2_50_63_15]
MQRVRHLSALLRSSPIRLAIGLVAVFATVNFVSLGLAWIQLRGNVEDQISANLEQQVAGFRVTGDPRTLAALVEAEAAAVDPANRILVFVAPSGDTFGNATASLRGREVEIRRRRGGRSLGEEGYELRTEAMAQGILVVGESRAPIRNMEETFIGLLVLSIIPTLLISLAAGFAMSLAAARRVRHFETTLTRLAQGDLAARVAEDKRGDDLSRIGAGIDRMAAAQEASMSALRQVSADIAHDLKTPVQRISVLLADLRNRLPAESPEAGIAERAVIEADRAVSVFQALLMIAQIEGGSARSRFEAVDLSGILSTFADIYSPAAEDSGHALRLSTLPEEPVLVRGDKTLLGQLVANLIENALRHTPEGCTVTLALIRQAEETVLSVADDGPGIPESERAAVLRRLYRLESARTTPGNGLGLSLVHAIADLHEARLDLHDNKPGLRVQVSFPPMARAQSGAENGARQRPRDRQAGSAGVETTTFNPMPNNSFLVKRGSP